ncbi:hypothetical protein ABIE65_002866 [Constrictibacter sp. MBR-5]|jgi:hypothetical protein|uniref:polysaccharide deacetylase family protein n=1 Tax=Constrictibacter sp. MBR-5 TaxID=3156467 RepID=UPI003396A2FE
MSAAATEDWDALDAELDRWTAAGRTATFWWRDDDAVDDTPALGRLAEAADAAPIGLAVIPAGATEALAARLAAQPGWTCLQHGFRHANHAPPGEKKAEFGAHRAVADMLGDLAHGRRLLEPLFGRRFLPMLVPPWNRIAAELAAALSRAGYRGLSAFGDKALPAPGLIRLDCHCDPVDWHGTRGFIGVQAALAPLLHHLRARRSGDAPDRATGLLTHHLAMDDATWRFCAMLRQRTALHTAARWVAPAAAIAAADARNTEADRIEE